MVSPVFENARFTQYALDIVRFSTCLFNSFNPNGFIFVKELAIKMLHIVLNTFSGKSFGHEIYFFVAETPPIQFLMFFFLVTFHPSPLNVYALPKNGFAITNIL